MTSQEMNVMESSIVCFSSLSRTTNHKRDALYSVMQSNTNHSKVLHVLPSSILLPPSYSFHIYFVSHSE